MTPAFKLATAVLLILAAWVLLSLNALAGTATLSWTLPTQNTDGSAITAGTLASTTVAWGTCGTTVGTFGTEAGRSTVAAPGTSYAVQNLTGGTTYCFRAQVATTTGIVSDWSAVVSKAVPVPVPPTPKPPVITTVATVAYEITVHPVDGPRLGRNVGTVALGTACVGEPIVGYEYFEVPRETVKFTKTPKSAIVVAKCA